VKTAVDFSQVRNVLILRTDHLGDLLLSTPLIRTLRQALPGRRFTLVASPANSGALTRWDGIDEIRLFDPQWPLLQKWRFARELGREQWDLCLTLSPRTPSYILGWLSGAPIRTGIVYSRRAMARLLSPLWLTHPVMVSVDELLAEKQPAPHEVMQLTEIAAALGLAKTEPGPLEIPLNPSDVAWAQQQLGQQPLTLIGIHGAGKWLSQGWTATDFMAMVRSVLSGCTSANLPQAKLLLTFGPGDGDLAAAVTQEIGLQPDPNIILPGPLSIPRWAAFTSLCDVVITPDTGSLHLAVAVNRPVVAMYESSTFLHCSTQWAPWQVPHALIRRGSPAATIPVIVAETLRLLSAESSESDHE
jgi:heptosyltransferase-2/heptosyltransferase-3